jgi:hypothetical protein
MLHVRVTPQSQAILPQTSTSGQHTSDPISDQRFPDSQAKHNGEPLGNKMDTASTTLVDGTKSDKLYPPRKSGEAQINPHETRSLLYKLLGISARLMPEERVNKCSKHLIHGSKGVSIVRNPSDGKAWYAGVQHCSSIWNCPVCANRISEFRRRELLDALKDAPYEVVMVTYTLRHERTDDLEAVLAALKEAYRLSKNGRFYQSLQEEFGIVGSIRTIEPPYGDDNGWHPHIHELLILDKSKMDRSRPEFFQRTNKLRTKLRRRWLHCLEVQGRDASWERGLKLNARKDCKLDYVAKLQLSSELTRNVNKKSRSDKGITPFGMLEKILQGEKRYEALFKEYATVFKGTRQLYWSKGLKPLLHVGEVDDTQVPDPSIAAATNEPENELLIFLEWSQWKKVFTSDKRGELLHVASLEGKRGIVRFMRELGVWLFDTT